MTSQSTLNEEQLGPYYHGTSKRFKEGDVLRGPGQGGKMTFDPPHFAYSPEHVYSTTLRHSAEGYAQTAAQRHGGTPTVYEIKPGEGLEKDPETEGVKGWDYGWRSPTAHVVREVGMRE